MDREKFEFYIELIREMLGSMGIGTDMTETVISRLSGATLDAVQGIWCAGPAYFQRLGIARGSTLAVDLRLFLALDYLETAAWNIYDWRFELGETPEFERLSGELALDCLTDTLREIQGMESIRPAFE